MALTRKFLTALGIEADKVDEIITAHVETVDALKQERDEFKTMADDASDLKKKLNEANELIEASKGDAFKDKYEELKKEFESFKADTEAKVVLATKEAEYRKLLIDSGVSEKRIDSIMKLTNLDEVEIDENGLVKADELKEAIEKEWSDFIVSEKKEGAGVENPPSGDDGAHPQVAVPTIF